MKFLKDEITASLIGIMLLAFILALSMFLGGCASYQEKRAELFAPEGLPSNKAVFSSNYSQALKAIDKGTATPSEVVAYVDAGNLLNAKHCNDWMDRLSLARRGYIASDHNMAIAVGLLTTLAGAFAWPADVITLLGAGTVALQGFSQNAQNDILGAPSQHVAQQAVLEAQAACADELLTDAPKLKFSQAYTRLEACARVCSHDSATDMVNKALR